MQTTLYAEIDALLSDLLTRMQQVLGANLAGLTLYGSLVSGDFDLEISDIDLLAVTVSDINTGEIEQLRNMHDRFAARNPDWENRIEVQYVSTAALESFKTERSQIAVISPGEPFNVRDAGTEWLINWYLVREQSNVLLGVNPNRLIPPISKQEFLQASRDRAQVWGERANQPRDQKGQSYAILTLCRALYASHNGERVSKIQAALWAQKQFRQWAPLIQNALVWRKAPVNPEDEETFSETARFISFALGRIDGAKV